MKVSKDRLSFVMSAVMLCAAGCGGEFDSAPAPDREAAEATIRAALGETQFTTIVGPVSISATSSTLLAVWTGRDALGVTQVVGQAFNLNGQPLTNGGPRIYSTGIGAKTNPVVSGNSNNNFLIVFEKEVTPTDSDVVGVMTDTSGVMVGNFIQVNVDQYSEHQPSILNVESGRAFPNWLVSYTRTDFSACPSAPSFTATWIGYDGSKQTTTDVVPKCTEQVQEPEMAFDSSRYRLMMAWKTGSSSSFKFAFSPVSPFALGSATTVTGTSVSSKAIAYNRSTGVFGMAWRDQNGSFTDIRSRTFPAGCESLLCANPETSPTPVRSYGPMTNVGRPAMVPYLDGFSVYGAIWGAGIGQLWHSFIRQNGALKSIQSASDCSGGTQGPFGADYRSLSAAVTPLAIPTPYRSYVMYDRGCSWGSVIGGTGMEIIFSGSNESYAAYPFNISN